ncbi:hypothetical protein FNJ87_03495 [Nonlabens mediterrranea]|uniref:LSU ribosomal protein L21p n=1 Tax=Nonlabens mediterrranea TaxID=1419947 RepID=A0ABS0A245_9FLAO|nr:hypothetical protein [Nonlabens mediterrranea]
MDISNIWCWLCPLITGIIAGIIGYYWGKSNSTVTNNCDEWIDKNRQLQSAHDNLKADLHSCQTRLDNCIKDKEAAVSAKVSATAGAAEGMASGFVAGATQEGSDESNDSHENQEVAVLNFNAVAAKTAMGKKIKADDLTTVEGIGPKIAELFHNNNIKTWYSLSTSSIEERKNVLNSGGKRFEIHNPESWALQAGMAFDGKWEELAKWQGEHKGGRM